MSISQNFPEEGPTLNLNFAGSRTLDPRITFTRTSTGTYMGSDGLIKVAPADSPRFDHRYVNGEIESLGLLVEEDRSNLFTYSTFYGDNGLSNVGINTNVSGISAPDGTFTAAEMYGSDSTNNVKYMYKSYLTNTLGTYTTSVFMKYKNERYTVLRMNDNTGVNGCLQRIDIQNGIFTNPVETGGTLTGAASTITAYPNGWYRVSLTGTFVDALTQVQGSQVYITTFGATTSTNGIYLWGAQLEQGSFATSHIPRPDASTATRNPDNVSMTGDNFSDWYNQSEGTLYVRANTDAGSGLRGVAALNLLSNFGDNRFDIRYDQSGSSRGQFNPTSLTRTSGFNFTNPKFILSYATDYRAFGINADITQSTSSFTPSTNVNTLIIGNFDAGTNYYLCGTISQLTYYPTRLTNAQLQNLTK